MSDPTKNAAILLIHCPDKPGIVVAITDFIHNNGGNILYLDQHVDNEKGLFFMRVEWDLARFSIADERIGEEFLKDAASGFDMQWQLYFSNERPRMALFSFSSK